MSIESIDWDYSSIPGQQIHDAILKDIKSRATLEEFREAVHFLINSSHFSGTILTISQYFNWLKNL